MNLLLLFLTLYLYQPQDWFYLPPMDRVETITADPFQLYIVCPNAVFVWDKGGEKIIRTITRVDGIPEALRLGGYDPETGMLWILSSKELAGYNPLTRSIYGCPNPLSEATSLGIGPGWIYLATRDKILRGDKRELHFTSIGTAPAEVVWYGARSPYKTQDYLFLTPYYYTDDEFHRHEITCLYEDSRSLWVGTDGYGVFRYDRFTLIPRHLRFGPAQAQTDLIYVDEDGLWFLHPDYLSLYSPQGDSWSYYDRRRALYPQGKGLLSFNLWELARQGRLLSLVKTQNKGWVGSNNGLWFWDPESGDLIRFAFQDTTVRKTLPIGDTLFVATDHGLWRLTPEAESERIQDPYHKLGFGVRDMAQAGEDLYLAAQSGVLARDSAGDFKLLTLAGVDLVHPLQAIAGYGRYLFMATQSGLVIYDVETDRYERIGLNDGLLSDQINGLWADATHLWIATPKGLFRFNYHAVMP